VTNNSTILLQRLYPIYCPFQVTYVHIMYLPAVW
jgi:hypothetical protein